jgi:tetratricopeptide repeat protein
MLALWSRSHYRSYFSDSPVQVASYGRGVAVLSREQFDSIEFDAAASGDHAAAARMMTELATTGIETAGMPRAEAYVRAGEQWLLADDPAEALTDFRRAMADGGPVDVDPRVHLSRAQFQLGMTTDAQETLGSLLAEGPHDPRTCDLVAELLLEQSDLPGALAWATAGVEMCVAAGPDSQPGGEDSELRLLLRLRYRIRNDLGLAEDEYDALLDISPG